MSKKEANKAHLQSIVKMSLFHKVHIGHTDTDVVRGGKKIERIMYILKCCMLLVLGWRNDLNMVHPLGLTHKLTVETPYTARIVSEAQNHR